MGNYINATCVCFGFAADKNNKQNGDENKGSKNAQKGAISAQKRSNTQDEGTNKEPKRLKTLEINHQQSGEKSLKPRQTEKTQKKEAKVTEKSKNDSIYAMEMKKNKNILTKSQHQEQKQNAKKENIFEENQFKTLRNDETKYANQENKKKLTTPTGIEEMKATFKSTNSEITTQEEILDGKLKKNLEQIEEPEIDKELPENNVYEELNDEQKKMLEVIIAIEQEVKTSLESQVNTFNGINGSKEYFILDEHLLQCLEKLDKLQVKPYPDIREKRKILIKKIHQLMDDLDKNAIDDD